MINFEKIVKIIENNSPEVAAEEILHLFSIIEQTDVCPTCNDEGLIMCNDSKNICPDCICSLD